MLRMFIVQQCFGLSDEVLRQYLPKGTDLSIYSQEKLDAIADSLNSRSRATHNWRTPLQVFAAALASSHQPDTSIH